MSYCSLYTIHRTHCTAHCPIQVGFEPAYGYRRHGPDAREEEEEEEEDDFLAWARIIGQGEGREQVFYIVN